MKKIILSAVALSLLTTACLAQKKGKDKKSNEKQVTYSRIDSVSYAIGLNIGKSLQQGIDTVNAEMVGQAIKDLMSGKKKYLISDSAANVAAKSYFMEMQTKKMAKAKEEGLKSKAEGDKFLAENKTKKGVVTTASGLQYIVLKAGAGEKPKATDKVKTHYHGTLINGKVFDSSVERGEPITFPVNGVIKGWTEALQLMPVGSKWKLFIPSELAYGEQGAGADIAPNSVLIFEVELLSIEKSDEKPEEEPKKD